MKKYMVTIEEKLQTYKISCYKCPMCRAEVTEHTRLDGVLAFKCAACKTPLWVKEVK